MNVSPIKNQAQRRRKSSLTPTRQASSLATGVVQRLPNILGQAAMLEWLGQSPIAFHRAYVSITGSVLPALWLSSAMQRVSRAHAASFEANGDFVFSMSAAECEAETGISRSQQASCRRQLIAAGLLSEQAEKRKATVYRLHLDHIARRLLHQAAPLAEQIHQLDQIKPANRTPVLRSA